MQIKKTLVFLVMLMLALPAIQKQFNPVSSKPLSGVFSSTPEPSLACSTWMKGSFQEQYGRYLDDFHGFKPDFVRIYNQVDFSLFSMAHAERIIIGKKQELFASEYIIGYLGQNFPGYHFIDEKVRMLKFVQDYLWKNKRILVMVLIPPDKGSLYPELIPDRYLEQQSHETGRHYFSKLAREKGLNVLDFNPWFAAIKDTCRHRLIPTTGVHWSNYGSFLAADSATRYFEEKTGLKFPRLVLDSLEISTQPRNKDDDINQTMNLIWDAPHEPLAYPCFHVTFDSSRFKPAALFVADSFIWGWWDQPIIQNLFRNQEIWYYDQEIYPESFTRMKYTRDINLQEAIERQDIVVLFQVGAGSGNPGAGVIDRLYALYDTSGNNLIRKIEQKIFSDSAWLAQEKVKAEQNKVPLTDIVRRDAIYLFNAELQKNKAKFHHPGSSR